MNRPAFTLLIGLIFSVSAMANGQEVLKENQISLGLAHEAAVAAIEQCRNNGFQVAVTIVDRAGQVKVMMRDDDTGPHTTDTSRRKAYTSLTLRRSTTELANQIAANPAAAGLKDITDVIVLGGGLPIQSGGQVIGAIGVSGAPGGDRDEVCAQAGINRISGQLQSSR